MELWSNKWLLTLNSSKTKVVFFSKKEISVMPKLFFNGDRLDFVSVHRHLGPLILESLSWTNFIDSVVNSASKKIGLLKKTQVQNWQKKLIQIIYFFYQTYA